MKDQRGWTLIELFIVIVILGLLSLIGALKVIDLRRNAFAARVASEFVTIRLAAYTYETDHNNQWPADQGPGVVPPELQPYLPSGMSFVHIQYTLDWDNYIGGGGGGYLLGITCTSPDPRFVNALIQNLGTRAPYFVSGGNLTFVLIDASGNY